MNVPAPESSPALNTKHGTTGMNQPCCSAWRAGPQPVSRAVTPEQPVWARAALWTFILAGYLHSFTAQILLFTPKCKNTKQAVQSLCFGHSLPTATRVWWRRDGEQHREDTSSAHHRFSLGIREGPLSPRGTASQSSATGIEALWGQAPLWPHTNTLHPAAKNRPVAAWAMVWLHQVEIFAHWREFPAWRGMGQCPSFLQCSPRGGGEAVIFCCQKWAG